MKSLQAEFPTVISCVCMGLTMHSVVFFLHAHTYVCTGWFMVVNKKPYMFVVMNAGMVCHEEGTKACHYFVVEIL